MKRLAVVLLLAGCANSGDAPSAVVRTQPTPPATIQPLPPLAFLVAGQSNHVSITRTYPPIASEHGKVLVSDYNGITGDFDDHLSVPTVANPTPASSVWVRLGDLINKPCAFVNVSVGGTHIAEWQTIYLNKILTQVTLRHFTAVLWGQGESDEVDGTSSDAYYNALKSIINASRQKQPGLVWFIAMGSGNPNNNPIRSAQQRIVAEGIAEAGPVTDDLIGHVEMDPGNVHFIGSGAQAQAQSWYNVLLNQGLIN